MKPAVGKVFIYVLAAEGEKARYVGVTKGRLCNRLAGHMRDARNGAKTHKANWIRKCIAEGRKVFIIPVWEVLETDWPAWEQAAIGILKNLTNGCAGGRGVLSPVRRKRGHILSAEVRAKIGAANKASFARDPSRRKELSEITRLRMAQPASKTAVSRVHKGKRLSEDTKRKLSEAATRQFAGEEARQAASVRSSGWHHSEEARQRIGAAARGHTSSAATRRKIAAARLAWWAARRAAQNV